MRRHEKSHGAALLRTGGAMAVILLAACDNQRPTASEQRTARSAFLQKLQGIAKDGAAKESTGSGASLRGHSSADTVPLVTKITNDAGAAGQAKRRK